MSAELSIPVSSPYYKITIGSVVYTTKVSTFGETFEFKISLHAHLFWTLQVDLFDHFRFMTDKHLGRVEVRLCNLEGMPDHFTSWFELWNKRSSISNTSDYKNKTILSDNLGAIQLDLTYQRQSEKVLYENPIEFVEESQTQTAQTERTLQKSPVQSESLEFLGDAPARSRSQSDMLEDKFYAEEEDSNLSSFFFKLYGMVLPETALPIMRNVHKLMVALGQGMDLTSSEMAIGFLILDLYYQNIPIHRTNDFITDAAFINTPRHLYKFSMACYGWKGLNFAGKGNGILRDSIRNESDLKSVLEFLMIPRCDLLIFDLRKDEALQPSFFVCIDWYTQSIVLAIRGTMSALDTLTDLACEYEEWHGGYVHSGMKKAADWFLKNVFPQILHFAAINNLENIMIVGHSLGAGTAAITTILFQEELEKRNSSIKVHCHSFAPPPIVSLSIAKKFDHLIDSYVYGNDLVPRLSYGAFLDFKTMLVCAAENGDVSCFFKTPTGDSFTKIITALNHCREKIKSRSDQLNPKLYLAGSIYHMYTLPIPQNPKHVVVERSNPLLFSELNVRPFMFIHHLPAKYEISLNRAFECLIVNKTQRSERQNVETHQQ